MEFYIKDIRAGFKAILIFAVLCFFLLSFPVHARSDVKQIDITELSLEELMDMKITSVSKKPQKMYDAAAAVFVITQDDIRRSGVTSIPEALRLAPGLEVARIDANKWAITSRGFNGRFANKLLVLIDGRSVYTPLFSGVFWQMKDTMLEDVERIEVIRGPGATLWGANAVNGVINIITKNAAETRGGLVSARIGTEDKGSGSIRYGAKVGEDAYFRVYAKYTDRDNAVFASGSDANDNWDLVRSGFRLDWESSEDDSWTLQGDVFGGNNRQTVTEPSLSAPYSKTFQDNNRIGGGNILTRWKHVFSESSDMALRVYYDRTEHEDTTLREDRDTFDIDFQHRFALGESQEILWGGGYRFTSGDIGNRFSVALDPDSRKDHLYSAFVQDDITLLKDQLRLTIGSKFEHNDYTGFEYQPNARLLITPDSHHTIWAAVSRAVRTPSQVEHNARINTSVVPPGTSQNPSALPVLLTAQGDDDFKSEELTAYEVGYRVLATDNLFVDIATFYNVYDNLRTLETGATSLEASPAPLHLVLPSTIGNKMSGETYGAELAADWRPMDGWRLQATYSYLRILLHLDDGSTDTISESAEDESPRNQFSLRSSMDIARDVEFDLWLRYVDDLPSLNVDSYVSLDARLGWNLRKNLVLSIVGRNLLDNRHPEFGTPLFVNTLPTEVERSVYGKIEWGF